MMDEQEVIARVKQFATDAHEGQQRKYGGDPYIVHPVRVMEICREHTSDPCILCAALLHDVIEDTPVTAGELLTFLKGVMPEQEARRTAELVSELTDQYVKSAYPKYNRRKRKDLERERMARNQPDAQTVKYADILDNCSEIVRHDPDFARVFLNECRSVLRVIDKGDPQLYDAAKKRVESGLEQLRRMQ